VASALALMLFDLCMCFCYCRRDAFGLCELGFSSRACVSAIPEVSYKEELRNGARSVFLPRLRVWGGVEQPVSARKHEARGVVGLVVLCLC